MYSYICNIIYIYIVFFSNPKGQKCGLQKTLLPVAVMCLNQLDSTNTKKLFWPETVYSSLQKFHFEDFLNQSVSHVLFPQNNRNPSSTGSNSTNHSPLSKAQGHLVKRGHLIRQGASFGRGRFRRCYGLGGVVAHPLEQMAGEVRGEDVDQGLAAEHGEGSRSSLNWGDVSIGRRCENSFYDVFLEKKW